MKAPSLLAVMALTLGAASACSLLISDEAEPIACSDEGKLGPPACDPGFSCQGGVCRAASGKPDEAGGKAGQAGQSATATGAGGGAGGAAGEGEPAAASGAGAAGAADRRR